MEIISCPAGGCDAPAEITDRWTWGSTDGPMEHVRTFCARGHGFTVPTERLLAAQPQPQAQASARTLDQALAEILHRPAA